jgi:phage anti-repressor protein
VVAKSNNEIPSLTPDPLDPIDPLDPATGTKRDKKEFSQRQLQLPQKQYMSCRHCNEAEKDEAKAERRKSLDESRELKTGEVHNKGRQVHNNFKSMSRVA